MYLQAVGNASAVVNKVKNQLLAYILVWKLWDWKCTKSSGM